MAKSVLAAVGGAICRRRLPLSWTDPLAVPSTAVKEKGTILFGAVAAAFLRAAGIFQAGFPNYSSLGEETDLKLRAFRKPAPGENALNMATVVVSKSASKCCHVVRGI